MSERITVVGRGPFFRGEQPVLDEVQYRIDAVRDPSSGPLPRDLDDGVYGSIIKISGNISLPEPVSVPPGEYILHLKSGWKLKIHVNHWNGSFTGTGAPFRD